MVLFWVSVGLLACDAGSDDTGADSASGGDTDTEVIGGVDDTAADSGDDSGDEDSGDTDEDPEWEDSEEVYATLFDVDAVQRFDLTVDDAAIQSLRRDGTAYVHAVFEHDNVRIDDVGLRIKGSSTLQSWDGKPSLKIKFNEWVPGTRYGTLERLTLNNMVEDPTQSKEVLAYWLWAQGGMVAPRAAFAEVYVNGELFGLYANVESTDDHFVKRHFADGTGTLWEGNDYADFTYDGVNNFELVSGVDDDTDLRAARRALAEDDWYAATDEVINLDQFLDFWAWSVAIGNADGYPFNQNDFFVYDDPADGRFVFTPWGVDESWNTAMSWNYVSGYLGVKCVYDAACTALLGASVSAALDAVEAADPGAKATALHALTEPIVRDDPRRPSWSAGEVISARAGLASTVETWPATVRGQMGI